MINKNVFLIFVFPCKNSSTIIVDICFSKYEQNKKFGAFESSFFNFYKVILKILFLKFIFKSSFLY